MKFNCVVRYILWSIFFISSLSVSSQTWVDSIDNFAREVHLPARNYVWNWQNASLLHAMETQYELADEADKQQYVDYVRIAMHDNFFWANGLLPNMVASGNGMAFMYRITADQRYLESANNIYNDYLNIVRCENGGVSHLFWTKELWDDTVYMIGVFLIAMYKTTGDEEYIDELIFQIKAHQEKLKDDATGLWVHGWDEDGIYTFDFCSQADWADELTGRSSELWGRGNGWVVVTLSELLNTLPEEHPERNFVENSLLEMIEHLPDWQDETTGHWYQLPAHPEEDGNFLESSCTAMFGYGILTALKHELIEGFEFENIVRKVYFGLREHSTFAIDPDNPYLNTKNVCAETCIGDRDYYYSREVANGRSYALAMDIIFGRSFEEMYMNDIPTPSIENSIVTTEIRIFPSVIQANEPLHFSVTSTTRRTLLFDVIDPLGRHVYRSSYTLIPGEHSLRMELPSLQAGNYFLVSREQNSSMTTTNAFVVH